MVPLIKNKSFLRSSEGAIASYSYQDIVNGFGYVSLYAMRTVYYNAGNNYVNLLSEQNNISESDYVEGDNADVINFNSSPFNTPRTIKGVAFIEYNLAINDVYAGTAYAYAKFEIVKVSGVTETSLGYVNGFYCSVDGSGWYDQGQHISQISLTETNFKIGDFVRLKITITGRTSGAGDDLAIFCDPTDAAQTAPVATAHSRLKLDLPFKIDA